MSTVRTSSGTGDDERTLSRWRTRLLDYIDGHARDIVADLADLVRVPSICGSDAENEIQFRLATRLRTFGLDVDHWKIPLTEMLCEADFPGVEVDRLESWGTGKACG
jgi:acetylornithine deacetylase